MPSKNARMKDKSYSFDTYQQRLLVCFSTSVESAHPNTRAAFFFLIRTELSNVLKLTHTPLRFENTKHLVTNSVTLHFSFVTKKNYLVFSCSLQMRPLKFHYSNSPNLNKDKVFSSSLIRWSDQSAQYMSSIRYTHHLTRFLSNQIQTSINCNWSKTQNIQNFFRKYNWIKLLQNYLS